ncbi:heavy-metal-associated domain-containing protein, partial [Candidatus Poribacteria bacterium]|nr:heavy-metal-associated domain-containing protein [Candidatus Poribacteria bacterium]
MPASPIELKVHGLDCPDEVALLRGELETLPGVTALSFDLLNARMTVECTNGGVPLEGLLEAVRRTGLSAEPWR